MDDLVVSVGALDPLTPPDWAETGKHLLAGLELGAEHVKALDLRANYDVAGRLRFPAGVNLANDKAQVHDPSPQRTSLVEAGLKP